MMVLKVFVLEPIVFPNYERSGRQGSVESSSLVAGRMKHAVRSRNYTVICDVEIGYAIVIIGDLDLISYIKSYK